MSRKKNTHKLAKGVLYVSRDRYCKEALSSDIDNSKCCLPYTHLFEGTYSIVYTGSHLDSKLYDCGCIIYTNKYYHEFKYPESIWLDFFHYPIKPGQKMIKYTISRPKL
jgi:hypothetical protein